MDSDIHDVVIIGGGPAGLSAGLYASRDRYSTLILEKNGLPGGQIMLTEQIENYPGWEEVTGPDLVEHIKAQAEKFGATIAIGKAVSGIRRLEDGTIEVSVDDGQTIYRARAVVLSPGSDYRQLGIPGESEMRQAGKVSYCATCDGAFYRDKHVMTIGGGNTAVEDTIYLATRFVRKTTMIHRRTEFRAQEILVEQLRATAGEKDIDIKLPYVAEEIVPSSDGAEIDHVRIRNVATGQTEQVKVDGVFIFAGMTPNTGWLKGTVQLNEAGYIACDCETLRTSMPGVFVAGDCRQGAAMQLATACGDGVLAAMGVKNYFQNPESWPRPAAADGPTKG